jgi:hypothetical protein
MPDDTQTYRDFWKRRKELRDFDLGVGGTSEDIRPGGGVQWCRLWNDTVTVTDDAVWASFLGGDEDRNGRREVRWLLGA